MRVLINEIIIVFMLIGMVVIYNYPTSAQKEITIQKKSSIDIDKIFVSVAGYRYWKEIKNIKRKRNDSLQFKLILDRDLKYDIRLNYKNGTEKMLSAIYLGKVNKIKILSKNAVNQLKRG